MDRDTYIQLDRIESKVTGIQKQLDELLYELSQEEEETEEEKKINTIVKERETKMLNK